ncbi:tyrosine-type recombinase/integrase [Aeromonas hydrophila]|uniref:tyrosine-type recombinase/integrase n=1 Tax=Aeromonas hydrophila TaxID=644 RepID=UPI003BDD24AC
MTEKMVVSRNTSINRLRDKAITDCKPTKVHVLADGGGLELTVKPIFSTNQASGEKVATSWNRVWSYRFIRPEDGKRTKMGLGNYPTVTLQRARELKRSAQELLSQGINPITHRADTLTQRRATEAEVPNTFLRNATDWFQLQTKNVKSRTAQKTWRSLEKHVFPKLGSLPIAEIRNPLIREALSELADQGKIETIEKLCRAINSILEHAVIMDKLDQNRCLRVRRLFQKKKVTNQLTIESSELPQLLLDVAASSMTDVTRALFMWSLHTLVRPGEAAGTRWDEIDLPNKVWTIPAERMKMKEEHTVPLSSQAIEILDEMQKFRRGEFVFPGNFKAKDRPMSSQTINMALGRMGYKNRLVSHGLRALGSTTLNAVDSENGVQRRFDPDAIEAVLSHVDKNDTARVYNRGGKYFNRRVELMNWWSEHIEAASFKE